MASSQYVCNLKKKNKTKTNFTKKTAMFVYIMMDYKQDQDVTLKVNEY